MIKILKEEVNGSILTVTASVPLRVRVSDKVVFVKSKDIIELISDRYDIVSTVKENQLSNSMRGNGKQKGQWDFQIRKAKAAPKKAEPRKPVTPAPKKVTAEDTDSEPTIQTTTKASTKPSIRGRMSKIAKEKINKK